MDNRLQRLTFKIQDDFTIFRDGAVYAPCGFLINKRAITESELYILDATRL